MNGLSKYYGKSRVVSGISFAVKQGEVFGFLGPNGSGKTTTIKSILDLIPIDAGEISINGFDTRTQGKLARRSVGYLPEKVTFYPEITPLQNLFFFAELKHASKEECKALIEEFGLGDTVKKKVKAFSKGMNQRLGLIYALLGSPSIVILDEPTDGLDAHGIVFVREKIQQLKKSGATVFLSSHILDEVQAVCDRVAIIHKGAIVAQGAIHELSKKLHLKPIISVEVETVSEGIIEQVKRIPGVDNVNVVGKSIEVSCDHHIAASVILVIANAGGVISRIKSIDPSLEEVFLQYADKGGFI